MDTSGTFQRSNAAQAVNASIDNPISMGSVDDRPMLGWIFSQEAYTQQYHELFFAFLDKWFTDGELVQMIERTAALIRPYVERDSTKFCTTAEFDTGVEAISQFVTLRAEAVRRQLDGDTTPVDTADLNLAEMGTMNHGMGGGMMGMNPGMPGTTAESTQPAQIPNWNAVSAEATSASDGVPADSPPSSEPQEPAESQPTMRPTFGHFPSGDGSTNFTGTQNPTSDATAWALVVVSVLVLALGLVVAIKRK